MEPFKMSIAPYIITISVIDGVKETQNHNFLICILSPIFNNFVPSNSFGEKLNRPLWKESLHSNGQQYHQCNQQQKQNEQSALTSNHCIFNKKTATWRWKSNFWFWTGRTGTLSPLDPPMHADVLNKENYSCPITINIEMIPLLTMFWKLFIHYLLKLYWLSYRIMNWLFLRFWTKKKTFNFCGLKISALKTFYLYYRKQQLKRCYDQGRSYVRLK
jgi:hypothetical protein